MNKKYQKGFSLVEVMIGAGALGLLSMGVMSTLKTMTKGQVVGETKNEEMDLRRSITTLLIDENSCNNTLVGRSAAAANADEVTLIDSSIQLKNGATTPAVMYKKNDKTLNKTLKIIYIALRDPGPSGAGTRSASLEVYLEKLKVMASAGTKFKVNIPVKAAFSAEGVVTSCFVDKNDILLGACSELGGTMDAAGKCINLDIAGDIKAITFTGGTFNGAYNGTTANLSGNIAAGSLSTGSIAITGGLSAGSISVGTSSLTTNSLSTSSITSSIIAAGQYCKTGQSGTCPDRACPAGSIANGIKPNGDPLCIPILCGQNTYFMGLNPTTGSPVCQTLPTSGCGPGQYISNLDPNGSVTCSAIPAGVTTTCTPGMELRGYTNGTATCQPYRATDKTCSASEFLAVAHMDGTFECKSLSSDTGSTMNNLILNDSLDSALRFGSRGALYSSDGTDANTFGTLFGIGWPSARGHRITAFTHNAHGDRNGARAIAGSEGSSAFIMSENGAYIATAPKENPTAYKIRLEIPNSDSTIRFYNADLAVGNYIHVISADESNSGIGHNVGLDAAGAIYYNNSNKASASLNLGDGNLQFNTRAAGGSSFMTKFSVTNTGTANLAGILTQNSDIRLKKDIRPILNSLDKIKNLKAVSYKWNDTGMRGDATYIGLIAQNVEKQFPELVYTSPNTGIKSVAYANLAAPLIEAVKEQQQQIDKNENTFLKILNTNREEINLLRDENNKLREALCSINSKLKICKN